MKKTIVLIAILFSVGGSVNAQTWDTIHWNERKPGLYYWGSNWCDSVIMAGYPLWISSTCGAADYFVGRTCLTSSQLSVMGIAAPAKIFFAGYNVDTARLPEYFQLYQHEGDSIYFVDEVRWDTATPSKYEVYSTYQPSIFYDFYEAYFDKPIIVHDTFYVGGTLHNNLMYGGSGQEGVNPLQQMHHPTEYFCSEGNAEIPIAHDPPYYIMKFFWPSNYLDYTQSGVMYDTSIFYIYDSSAFPSNRKFYAGRFWHFFAIFDTNFVPGVGTYSDSCLAPSGLHLEAINDAGVILAWNAGGETMWQLSLVAEGVNMNDGLFMTTPINYVTIDSLEMGHWYSARVRTLCDEEYYGEWSDPVQFYFGNPDDTVSCPMPQGLQVVSTNVGKVVLQWANGADAVSWETEVGPADVSLGNGIMMPAPTYFTVRNGLDTAMWYWARVRAVCGDDWKSLWSDTVMFYIPGDGSTPGDTTGSIITLAEQYTYLMPNPAREEVTVASSFRVKSVELYAADGKLLEHKGVNALSTTLDLRGLPAGVYFVRVATHAGMTTKRLVVE